MTQPSQKTGGCASLRLDTGRQAVVRGREALVSTPLEPSHTVVQAGIATGGILARRSHDALSPAQREPQFPTLTL